MTQQQPYTWYCYKAWIWWHSSNLVVTKDYHKLWLVCILFVKNVEIHVFKEKAKLILCSQVAYMLDKYFIKRYVVKLIFTQYVLCENARLFSAMILFGSSKMVSKFSNTKQNI
jgi:hypothetical protein